MAGKWEGNAPPGDLSLYADGQKSYESEDPVVTYCSRLSSKLTPQQQRLQDATIQYSPYFFMLGAPEVLQFGENFIQLIGAKRVLDIGTFTGASALAWALALPEDGQVITFDHCLDAYNKIGRAIIEETPEIAKKITLSVGPAVDNLNKLIDNGESGKFDFVFIDADKTNYLNYYKLSLQLLRPGGVIFIDNALWRKKAAGDPATFDETTKIINGVNEYISNDPASNSTLLNVGDGLHVAFKK